MTREQFIDASELTKLPETDKVCYLAFFYLKTEGLEQFTASDGARWLSESGISNPNQSRLDQNLRASRNTIKSQRGLKLTLPFVKELEAEFPTVSQRSQDVIDHGTILPEVDYVDTRGYIVSLAKQMNVSYEQNLFDGCAVLMRRLLEIMLILSYRKLNIENAIQDGAGNFKMLDGIINDARTNNTLALSRTSKGMLDTFRELGNFSAHRIEYTCRREYIQPHIQEYRALIVELLYKSGVRT